HRRCLLREKEGLYLLQTPDIKRIARRTFGRRVEQIRRQIRREQSVYRDVEQFFGQAGFDVNPLDSEYLLRPGAPARLPWGDVWAWLRLGEPLTPDEITELDGLARERNLSGPAFIVIAERPTPAAYRALMARNASDAPPLVPVDAQSIRRALAQRNPADTLDTLIRRAQPGYNHFALYTPVEDSLDFFGRQNILQTLAGRLTGGDPLLLTTVRGLPRVGLTSLLRRLQTRLEAIPCAAASLQYEQDAAGLRFAITRSLLQEARRKTPGATLSPLVARLSPARPGDPAVGQVFEALQQLSARQRAGRKFVVLVDATGPAAAAQTGLLREARSLAEAHPRLAFVLAANTFDQADLTLRPLSAAEAGTMVQSLLAAAGRDDWPPPVMDALFHYSGGHPWLLRQLGSALFKLDRFLEPADVEAAALALVERRSAYFEGLWDSLPQTAQNGLLNPSAGETTLPRELGLPTGLLQLWLELELGLEFEPGSL
ncbi:MAG: hypothetical protein ACE5G8_18265, partial [Anaerolineae bacterium]